MARERKVLQEQPQTNQLLVKGLTGSLRKRGGREVSELPDRAVMLLEHEQQISELAEYCRVTGFTLRDEVPATWLHVQTFGLQAVLLAEDDFPFPLAGLVHVTNEMTLLRPVSVGEKLRLSVHAEQLRPHAKGAAFDVVGQVHVADELVWQGRSNYLAAGAKVPGEAEPAERLDAPDVPPSQQWRLGPDLGRQYAAVSGDSNPIHLHPLTARAFGFPRPIAHGMWTHARALAGLGGELPPAYTVQVQFAKPILLPGRVGFAAQRGDDAWRFAVVNRQGKPHLVGLLS